MSPSRNLRRASRRCFKRFCMLLRRTSSNSASGRPSTTRVVLAVEPWFLKPEHIQILRSFGTKWYQVCRLFCGRMGTHNGHLSLSVSFCSSTSGKKETVPVGDSPSWSLHPQTKSKWSSRVGGKSTRMKPPPQPQPVYASHASRNDPKQFDTILPLQAPPGPHRAPNGPPPIPPSNVGGVVTVPGLHPPRPPSLKSCTIHHWFYFGAARCCGNALRDSTCLLA